MNVGKTMPCLPAMTGNGRHTTYNGDDWGMVYDCFYPHYKAEKYQFYVRGYTHKIWFYMV